MATPRQPPLLHILAAAAPDGACVQATLHPARGGAPISYRFCDEFSVMQLRRAAPHHWLVAVRPDGANTHIAPVTVALEVSLHGRTADGGWSLMVPPRPAPINVPAAGGALIATIEQAAKEGKGVVFAMLDPSTVADAVPVDRETATAMLGMVPMRQ